MLQQKILDKIFKVLDRQISVIADKSKGGLLVTEDVQQLETLTRVVSIANSVIVRTPGRPQKVKELDFVSDKQLAEYAKGQ